MKLAVFGATGGTGRHLVEQALRAGHDVRALVRTPDRAALPGTVRLIGGNVLDAAAVAEPSTARTPCSRVSAPGSPPPTPAAAVSPDEGWSTSSRRCRPAGRDA